MELDVKRPKWVKVLHLSHDTGFLLYQQVLLSKNAKVYIASRSRERALEAINKLKEETSKEAFFIELDVSDLKSVRMAVDEIKSYVNCQASNELKGFILFPFFIFQERAKD